jgi:4-coumarate--CoA ligase
VDKVGSIGWLLPNVQARLVDEQDDGKTVDVGSGAPGELWVRGANVMKVNSQWSSPQAASHLPFTPQGYLKNKQATKSSITPDKWFKTGDVAIVDAQGFFYIVDRRKELIKYKVGSTICRQSIFK